MKKIISFLLILCMFFAISIVIQAEETGVTYYISSTDGNDSNNGTSAGTPWKSLSKASSLAYGPGDKILLKSGDQWNETLFIQNSIGSSEQPILLSSYDVGDKPKIWRNTQSNEQCVKITDADFIQVTNLDIGFAGMGIQFYYNNSFQHQNITVTNCYFHDIYGIDQLNPSEEFPGAQFSSGILIGGAITSKRSDYTFVENIWISDCATNDVGSLFGGQVNDLTDEAIYVFKNLNFDSCICENNGIYGNVIGGSDGGTMSNCTLKNNGSRRISVGSTALMLGKLKDYTITDCDIGYQQRQGNDPDGCGVDFECFGSYVTMQNCNIHDNAGAGIMFFDNNQGFVNDHCNIINCTFSNNNQNVGNIGGYEVYFITPNANDYGQISGNQYYQQSGIEFCNTYNSTVTLGGNTEEASVPDSSLFSVAKTWELTSDLQGWHTGNGVQNFSWTNGWAGGNITDPDAYILSSDNLNVDITNNKITKIRLKNNSQSSLAKIYFTTDQDVTWNEAKHVDITIKPNDTQSTEYLVDMSSVSGWTGTLRQLRVNPCEGILSGSFSVDYIRIQNNTAIKTWDFTNSVQGWNPTNQITDFKYDSAGFIKGTITGPDSYLLSDGNLGADVSEYGKIILRMKNQTNASLGKIYFITDQDMIWDEEKHINFAIIPNDNNFTDYQIDISSIRGWKGSLYQIRVNPCEGASLGSFIIDSIKIQSNIDLTQAWEYESDVEGWAAVNDVQGFNWVSGGCTYGTISGSNPYIASSYGLETEINGQNFIKIRIKNNTDSPVAHLYFITEADGSWNSTKRKVFYINTQDTNYTEYTLDMSKILGWNGKLIQLRLDPGVGATNGDFSLDYVRIQNGD